MNIHEKIDKKIKELQEDKKLINDVFKINKVLKLNTINAKIEELNWVLENL